MKNKNKIKIMMVIIAILIVGVCLGIKLYLKKDLEHEEQKLQDIYQKYGTVEKETVNNIIAKFNTEIMDGGLNTPAYDDYMVTQDDEYWFGLTEDISYYLQPVKFSGDKEKDIIKMSAIYFNKDNYNEENAIKYVKGLIKANNYDLLDEEIDNLIKDAKSLSSKKQTSNNGKGISVGFLEKDDNYIYQVIRLYK